MDESRKITKENFGEYEERVCRMECQREKVLAEGRLTVIVADILYCIYSPIALLATISFEVALPDSFLGLLVGIWQTLCRSFWHRPRIWIFSALLATFLFPIILFVLALFSGCVIRRKGVQAHSGLSEEADLSRAKAVLARYRKVTGDAVSGTVGCSALIAPLICTIITTLMAWFGQVESEGYEAAKKQILVIVVMCVLFGVMYFIHHWFGLFLYTDLYCRLPHFRIRGDQELEDALNQYVNDCEKQERLEARMEEERKRAEIRQRGDELYRQAIAEQPVDEGLIGKAADMGSCLACLHMCRQALTACFSGELLNSYTDSEIDAIAEKTMKFCEIASQEESSPQIKAEATFGYLTFQYLYGQFDADKSKKILTKLWDVRQSGFLPERWQEHCSELIHTIATKINDYQRDYEAIKKALTGRSTSSSAGAGARSDTPRVKRCYCKFYTAGVCGRRSSTYSVVHCDHVADPGQCSTALLDNGLGFEFYE